MADKSKRSHHKNQLKNPTTVKAGQSAAQVIVDELAPPAGLKPFDLALTRLGKEGQALLNARADEIIDLGDKEVALRFGPGQEPTNEQRAEILVNIIGRTIKNEGLKPDNPPKADPPKPPATQVKAPSPTVKKIAIKKEDLEDLGNCNGCGQALKRTAFNSLMDAVRCVNPRCMLYRDVQKRIHRKGVKNGRKENPVKA